MRAASSAAGSSKCIDIKVYICSRLTHYLRAPVNVAEAGASSRVAAAAGINGVLQARRMLARLTRLLIDHMLRQAMRVAASRQQVCMLRQMLCCAHDGY